MQQNDPWLDVWLEVLQPKAEHFDHTSSLHGEHHTARVMLLAWVLGQKHAPLHTQDLIAAAFIHDMARVHDGHCLVHGAQAVKTKLPHYKKLLHKAGARNFTLIANLVENHCLPASVNDSLELKLFRTADALDRVRLAQVDDRNRMRLSAQDITYLYDASPTIITLAEELFEAESSSLTELFELIPCSL